MRIPQHQNQVVCGLFKLSSSFSFHFYYFMCQMCKM